MTKELNHVVLASGPFAAAATANWQSLGEHDLRGVSERFEIFTLADSDAVASSDSP